VEHPRGGDDTRQWGPPYLRDAAGNDTSESAYYLATNRGKRSLAIDFGRPEGADLVRRLAAQADVLVENFKPGGSHATGSATPTRADQSWPRLPLHLGIRAGRARRCEAGLRRHDPGHGGLMSLTGVPDGEPGAGRRRWASRWPT